MRGKGTQINRDNYSEIGKRDRLTRTERERKILRDDYSETEIKRQTIKESEKKINRDN